MRRSGHWKRILAVFAVLALAGAAYSITDRLTSVPRVQQTVRPSAAADEPTVDSSPTSTPAPLPTASALPSQKEVKSALVIPGSQPTEIYIPRLKKGVRIATKVCPVIRDGIGNKMLDPDRTDYTKACYFVNPSYPYYKLPGTNATDVAVLAGHTWRSGIAAFNILYDWKAQKFTVRAGDEIWVRTVASGRRWLVYTATDTLTATKYAAKGKISLMNDPKVWGLVPTPGVLITIACLQPRDLSVHSSENIVIKWRFTRVQS